MGGGEKYMNSRIKELRKSLNLTQKEFGSIIGLKSSISEIELGNAPITDRTIIAICSKFNVNENWLRFGQGSMYIEDDKKFNEFFSVFNNLNEPLQDFLLQCAKHLIEAQNKM